MPVLQTDFSQGSNVVTRLPEAKINLHVSNVFDHILGFKRWSIPLLLKVLQVTFAFLFFLHYEMRYLLGVNIVQRES